MSFESEYLELRKKRKNGEPAPTGKNSSKSSSASNSKGNTSKNSSKSDTKTNSSSKSSSKSFEEEYLELRRNRLAGEDIAPVRSTASTYTAPNDGGGGGGSFKEKDSWFRSGAFDDGYDFGDISKTILGTGYDITKNLAAGVLGMGEKAVDAVATGLGKASERTSDKSPLAKTALTYGSFLANPILGVSALIGSVDEDFSEKTDEFVKKDLYDENKVADWIAPVLQPGLAAGKLIGLHDGEEDSVLGSKSDALVQSAGQLGATAALTAAGVPWWATTAITSYGGEVENALNQGATKEEAMLSGAISAGAEILTEKFFGGIKFPGMGTFDDGLTKMLARGISNKAVRTALKLGIDVVGEGGEEYLSGLMSAIGQKITYADEKELNELFSSEDAWESFIGGAVLGGAGGAVQATGAKVQGRDYASGLTANEEAVVKKLYEAELAEAKKNGEKVNKNDLWDSIVNQMDRGEISIDTIEEVLGGDEYAAYKSLVDEQNAHLKDLAKMFEGDELKAQTENYLSDSKRDELKSQLGKNVFGKVITEKGSRLLNSYAETEARGVKFTANVDDYEGEYAKKTIQNIIDAESGNNTRLMHELADLLAKTSEDKKTVFSITDAKKLAGTSFAFKDQTTDGYVVRDANGVVKEVVINLDSPKYLNRVVGHEVTHILEGTEFYDTFRGVVEEYARSKGEYETELADAIRLYSDKDGYKGQAGLENIKKEVVANLVGKYIFSDSEFVKNLSVKNRNIFEKVYDEIKYFCKVAKAGSKEEKQLLKVKKAFEDAYRAEGVKKTDGKGTTFSISESELDDILGTGWITKLGYKVSEGDSSTQRYKGDTETKGKVAKLTDERINRLFGEYGASNPQYAQAYITSIHPRDFLSLTLSDESLKKWDKAAETGTHEEVYPLDIEKLKGQTQTPFLEIDSGTGEVVGHEGRHRMRALLEAGVTDVPIAIIDYNTKYSKKHEAAMRLTSQEFSNGAVNNGFNAEIKNLIPINAVNKSEIVSAYGGDGDIRYSLSEAGLDYDAKSGTVSYSLTSLNDAFAVEKGVEEYQAARKEYETALAKSFAEDPENITDEEKAKASRYLDNLFLIGEMIANDRERLDYEAAVNKSAWVSNFEYGGSIDFSTLCAKRRIFTGTFDAIQEALPDTVLTENDFLTIRNLLLEAKVDAPCSMCYVEGSRAKHGLYVAKFITDYKKTNPEWVPQIADFASANRLEQTRIQHPKAYEKYVEAMNKLSQRKPKEASVRTDYKGEILDAFKDNAGSVAQKNLNGGVRFNSFSDFEIIHALDCMQVLTDMSRVGLNGQAYTKVTDFAEAFGDTGLKINLSLVAKDVDADGNLVFDEVNGMKYSDANDLRSRYSENVGTVIVVFNDAQLKAALADGSIDYVLPFHRSQWKKSQYDAMGLPGKTKDYTIYQNDKVKNPKSKRWVNLGKLKHKATYTNDITGETYEITGNIMPNQYWDYNASGRENAQRYLDYINANGLAPKFYFLLDNVDGKWVLPDGAVGDGYFKLLIDFKMYNNEGWGSPQNPVAPEFNMPFIKQMLKDYKGGHKSFPVAQDVVNKFVALKQVSPSKPSMPKFEMPDSMAMSLSEEGVTPVKHSATEISGADVRLQTPVVEVAPVAETADVAPAVDNTIPEGFTPVPERVANEQQTENISTITDADAPAEVEPSAPEQTTDVSTPRNPFEQRDYTKVGSTKTKSFVEENPDAQSFFQEAARAMLGDLRNSQKGQRWYNDRLYYESGGENGLGGVQRETTQDIADLLDGQYHYSYQQIDDALNFIIHGEKLNACAKRIEFALNDRLMNGYTDVYGNNIPPNQDYINLLNQMQTAEDVNRQGSGAVFTDADVPVTDIVPSKATAPKVKASVTEDVAPSKVAEEETEERLAQERRFDPKANEGSWWSRTKKTINDALTLVGDKGWAVENLSKKTGNRALEALYDFYRNRTKGVSQEYINERLIPMWEKIEKTGKLSDFSDYARHLLNIDRMSLETAEETARRAELKTLLDGYNEKQIEMIASERIKRNTPEERKNLIHLCQEYVDLGGEKGKNKPVFGYSMTAERSRQKVAEYEANNPEFKEWEAEILAYNKALRDFAVAEGLISKKTAKLWANMYPHYVPISRTDKNNVAVNVPLDTNKTGVNSPFKRAKGGNSDFEPLFETMAKNTEQIFRAAHRNRFGIELMDTIEASYIVDADKSTDKKTRQAVLSGRIPAGTRVKAFDRNNIGTINFFNPKTGKYNVHFEGERGTADADIDARLIAPLGKLRQNISENAESDANEVLETVEENDGAILKKGENGIPSSFTVFVKGKRVEFDISEEIFNAVKPTNETLAKTFAPSNWLADKYKKLLTEYNPVFAFWRNPIKDAKDVLFNSQHAFKTYLNAPVALYEMFSKGEGKYIREYLQNGGKTNTYYDIKTKTFVKKKGIARKVVGFPVHAYQTASENTEMFWRLAEYIASRKEKRSVEVSMLDAARVTTNFGAGGDLTKFLNRNGAMFLNPSVQGAMQIVRNVREAHHQGAKGYVILAAKVLGVGLSGLVLNHLLWDDDDEYEELSDYVKQNYFILAKTEDGKFIRIPKGRMEAVIQYGFEQMENLITGDDEVDMENFAELVVNNLAPNNPLENNLTSPIKQVKENKTWYGEDLVPQRLQDLPANEQYDETTDEISKWFANTGVGKMLNVSPYKMNYLMQQYGGGLADTVLPMLTPEAENGSDSLLGNMIAPWKDEFVSDGVLKNQNVSDFYDLKDKLTINANASTATDEDYLKSSYMNAINSELSELYAQKREIQNNTYLSDKEKYAKVREIQQEIVDLTREAMNSYEDVNIQGTYATVGDVQYRYYTPGEDSTAEPGWRKLSAEQIEDQNKVTRGLGISASEYWSNKEEYDYAYEKPEKYAVAKSVGGYKTFRNVSSELNDIKADKDSSGKSISGSRKEKVIDYINGLDLDYGEKIILFKNEYNADDTYNWEIIEYLNGRSDISYKEMETILKELGFTVHSDGRITWD